MRTRALPTAPLHPPARRSAAAGRLPSLVSLLGLVGLAVSGSGCQSHFLRPAFDAYRTLPGVKLSSNPPGARILVDGRDSGWVTPALISLDEDPHTIDFELPGYEIARRRVEPDWDLEHVYWRDGDVGIEHWRFPVFWTWPDLTIPVKYDGSFSPPRIHVRLKRLPAESAPVATEAPPVE